MNAGDQVVAELERVRKEQPENKFAIREVASKIEGLTTPMNTTAEANSRSDAVSALHELAAKGRGATEANWQHVVALVAIWKKNAGF
jgi:hypothetical protein